MKHEDHALVRAHELELEIDSELQELTLPSPNKLFTEIRSFLYEQAEAQANFRNNIWKLLKMAPESADVSLIGLGSTFDKGKEGEYFLLDGGARLSFSIAVRAVKQGSYLISHRFHYAFPEEHSPSFIRFDLRSASHSDPLNEPRSHIHPGHPNLRIPARLMQPIEILHRIFYVLGRL